VTTSVEEIVTDDTTLATGLAHDLDGCFEQLMVSYQHRMYTFALRLTGSPQDAEEIAQDAFVRAYRGLSGYGSEQIATLALRPWLYRIALNVFRNRVRGKRPTIVSLDGDDMRRQVEPEDRAEQRPEAIIERAERGRELGRIVATLPERYRVAVVLRHVEGFGYNELSTLLRQPVGTVKANVHRGVKLLRAALVEHNYEVSR
jgi:RNA polymerase sigma-70 factor, ECF subfamily